MGRDGDDRWDNRRLTGDAYAKEHGLGTFLSGGRWIAKNQLMERAPRKPERSDDQRQDAMSRWEKREAERRAERESQPHYRIIRDAEWVVCMKDGSVKLVFDNSRGLATTYRDPLVCKEILETAGNTFAERLADEGRKPGTIVRRMPAPDPYSFDRW